MIFPQAPPTVLNMEVVEAKGLHGKDVNGADGQFFNFFLTTLYFLNEIEWTLINALICRAKWSFLHNLHFPKE